MIKYNEAYLEAAEMILEKCIKPENLNKTLKSQNHSSIIIKGPNEASSDEEIGS
jgi:hypothetical protein